MNAIEKINEYLIFKVLGYTKHSYNVFTFVAENFEKIVLRREEVEASVLWCSKYGTPEIPDELNFDGDEVSKYATPEEAKDCIIRYFSFEEFEQKEKKSGLFFKYAAGLLNILPGDNGTTSQFFDEGCHPNFIVPEYVYNEYGTKQDWTEVIYCIADGEGRELYNKKY